MIKIILTGEMSQEGADKAKLIQSLAYLILSISFMVALCVVSWRLPEIIRAVRWW